MARVDVILAVRDGAPYLGEALDSVFRQSLADLRLIVVDDGSTDRTAAVLAGCADRRLVALRTPGLGRPAARNLALARVAAPYTAILDGDDAMQPERLAAQAAFLDARPDVAVLSSAVTLVDPAGSILGRLRPPTRPGAIARLLPRRNCLVHPACMLRTSALRAAGGYREQFPAAQDYDLWLRLLDRGVRFAALAEPLTRYRVHPAAVSWSGRELQERCAALARACRRARKLGQPEIMDAAAQVRAALSDPLFHLELGRFHRRHGRPGRGAGHAWAAARLAALRAAPWLLLGRCAWERLVRRRSPRSPGGTDDPHALPGLSGHDAAARVVRQDLEPALRSGPAAPARVALRGGLHAQGSGRP